MRLKNIKLAGFKTFVDPITVPLSAQRVAVVGPNGCGKSNIIDAVRWVMGESSAKHLRGEAIADVIFNGSTARKPVGQASIELLFDNTDGRLGGEYAAYSEIAIRRQISRDGQSNYYLNGSRCRRRDILDVFLGTGLGPRNYAIIEQGKTRMAEAKPEELKADIEDAAGISKYKERRHETSLRIEHTRENLERLNDLRQEIEKQISHLQKQADAATRYTKLKEEERNLRAELFSSRARVLQSQLTHYHAQIAAIDTEFNLANTTHIELETAINALRDALHQAQENVDKKQAGLHQIDISLTKLTQAQQHQTEQRTKLTTDQAQAIAALKEAEQQVAADQIFIQQMVLGLKEAKETLLAREEEDQLAQQEQVAVRTLLQAWQMEWDTFQKKSAETQRQADVEQMRISELEGHLGMLSQQIVRLEEEIAALKALGEGEQYGFGEQWESLEQQINLLEQQLASINESMTALQIAEQNLDEEVKALEQTSQGLRESFASKDALQQVALGQQNSTHLEWLKHCGLSEKPRLAQLLTVEPGWERAIEVVLGFYLEAVCIEDQSDLLQGLRDLPEANLSVVSAAKGNVSPEPHNSQLGLQRLINQVTVPWSLGHLLADVYVVETLEKAWVLRDKLQAHESMVTPEGVWLGPNWLRIAHQRDEKKGLIQRERELSTLKKEMLHVQAQLTEKKTALVQVVENKIVAQDQKQQMQQQLSTLKHQQAEIHGQWQAKKAEHERSLKRLQQLEEQLATLLKEQDTKAEALDVAKNVCATAIQEIDQQLEYREGLLQQKEMHQAALTEKNQAVESRRQKSHDAALKVESLAAQLNATEQHADRLEKQMQAGRDRLAAVEAELNQLFSCESSQEDLQALKISHSEANAELITAKQELERLYQEEADRLEAKTVVEQKVKTLRDQLEHERLAQTTIEERFAALTQQMVELGCAISTDEPSERVDEALLEKNLEQIQNRVVRLGAINLAAIDELKEHQERKTYLDTQNDDLVSALDALENAIRQIDRETRQRFKETFDAINERFEKLFPQLFGGGHAKLVLSEEDCLVAGVQVIAQPPGKRNSSIHQLSGGEKALTAIALVFALFELNPAPFCILDEIDAPLDDANIGRFCALVKEMSSRVQFIFITHNKIAMEMAEHLIGVTMHEPGVSRLVAVDMQQAMNMVEKNPEKVPEKELETA